MHISGQTTVLFFSVLISILTEGLYPDSSFHPDSGLSQGGTDSYLHPNSGLHPNSDLHPDSGFFLAFLM